MVDGESGRDEKKRGRKASFLRLNGRYGFAVGVSVKSREIVLNVADFAGEPLLRLSAPAGRGREDTIRGMCRMIEDVLRSGDQESRGRPLGIGVSFPGLVDAATGVVLFSPVMPDWEEVQLRAILKERWDVDVSVDDSVRCMTLAEKWKGACREIPTFVYVYVGDGVGASIFLDNRLFRGWNGISGEMGHIMIKEDGPPCRCGNRGCLEALASSRAILDHVGSRLSEQVITSLKAVYERRHAIELFDIHREAQRGDKFANIVISDAGEYIGKGIATVVNVLDPGTVILGGEVVESFGEILWEEIERTVRLMAIPTIANRTTMKRSALGADSAALGAAVLVIEKHLGSGIAAI